MIDAPNLEIEIAKDMQAVSLMVSGRARVWKTRTKSGSMIDKPWWIKNGATTLGCNYILDTSFRGVTQITAWYVGIINASGYSGVAVGDTPSSHAGWTEFTSYSESVRQTWSPGAAAGGVLTNTTAMAFTINSSGNGQGVFVVSNSTKSATTGTLWSTAVEGSSFSLTSGVTFNVIYELTLTPVS